MLLHMVIGVRDLHNRTGQVLEAIETGERVTLTVLGEPIADIVPRGHRVDRLSGVALREQLGDRVADTALTRELEKLVGDTLPTCTDRL
jgi:prevent-host-death family protein